MYNGYTEWLQKISWPNGRQDALPLENLGDLVIWDQENNGSTSALGGAYPWKSGQDGLVNAVATGGLRDSRYWRAMYRRQSHSQAYIYGGYIYTFPNGTRIKLDALPIPNVNGGWASSSMASVVDAAQYTGISISIDIDPYHASFGIGIWGTAYSEGNLAKWASAMESLFRFNEEFELEFYNIDATNIPTDAPWPGYACSQDSLDHLGCSPE